ncbi:MAG: hypothetical protein GWN00_19905 [Aliifodinibius sp.]|nr:hypothetical protein [Fodinibius sp.]NIY26986.1 hypothetical protein [Fodinibius sp.]
MEHVYSLDDEEYKSFQEVMDDVNDTYAPGTKIEIYKAEKHRYTHDDFFNPHEIIEQMQEHAYGEAGEYSEDYLTDLSPSDIEEFRELIGSWLIKKASKPEFFTAKNTVRETVIAEEI